MVAYHILDRAICIIRNDRDIDRLCKVFEDSFMANRARIVSYSFVVLQWPSIDGVIGKADIKSCICKEITSEDEIESAVRIKDSGLNPVNDTVVGKFRKTYVFEEYIPGYIKKSTGCCCNAFLCG